MTVKQNSGRPFSGTARRTPISRILPVVLVLGLSACTQLGIGDNSPTAPAGPPAPGSAIVYDALGASDADGVGSSVECPPFTDCPNGMGYVQVAARELKAQGFSVSLTNYGIPTAVIGPDFQLLGQQNDRTIVGNLISNEMPFVRQNATVVTIFAGGNDINTITAALGNGAGGTDQPISAPRADAGRGVKCARDPSGGLSASPRITIARKTPHAGSTRRIGSMVCG